MHLLWILLASYALASPQSLDLPSYTTQLPNGLTVTLVQYPSPGSIAYQTAVRVGSRNETQKGTTGFAHFFEHLMFRGTKNHSSKEYNDLLTRLGAENNAETANDMTIYYGMVAVPHLAELLDAEADRFQNLYFSEKGFREEAGAVLGEYNKDSTNPGFQLEEKMDETAFVKHTYSHTTMGYKSDITHFAEKYKEVWPFFEAHYRPENTSVILVGDVNLDGKTLALVQKYFGAWKPTTKAQSNHIPHEPVQKEPREAEVKVPKHTQTRVSVGYKIPAFSPTSLECGALPLIEETYLSVVSDFQKTYRFEKQWIDSIDAVPPMAVDPGLWTITLRLSQNGEGKEQEILRALEALFKKASSETVDDATLAKTKERFKNLALLSWLGSPDALANQLSILSAFGEGMKVANQWLLTVRSTSPKDMTQFAQKYLQDNGKTTIILRGSSK